MFSNQYYTFIKIIIYYKVPSFEMLSDIFKSVESTDEPLGELNTERRAKISVSISKEGT